MPTLHEVKVDFVSLAEKYSGKWVAVHPDTGELLAVGATMEEVINDPAAAAVTDPIITVIAESYGSFVT